MDTPLAPQRFRDDETSLTCFANPRENTQHFKKKLLQKPLLALAISIDVLFIYFFRSVPRVESIAAD